MLLLWIIYVISVFFCYALMHVCLLMPCGHLLGKDWPLGSRLWCLIVTLSLSHWYPGSGVVLDCMDFWYLPSFLLLVTNSERKSNVMRKSVYTWDIMRQSACLVLNPTIVNNYTFLFNNMMWVRPQPQWRLWGKALTGGLVSDLISKFQNIKWVWSGMLVFNLSITKDFYFWVLWWLDV